MSRAVPAALVFACALCVVAPASAQDMIASSERQEQRTPRFLFAASSKVKPTPIDAASVPVLRDRISVQFENITVKEALDIVSRESGLRLFYSTDVISTDRKVRLHAQDITVAAALTDILLDANVDVVLGPDHRAALVRRTAAPIPPRKPEVTTGVVIGSVVESGADGKPLANAQVVVEDTPLGTVTDQEGRFRISGVPAGRRRVTAILIGYRRMTQEVEVRDSATATVDFALEVSPSKLDAVVVTVTGEQRLRELGHVVGVINADSLVKAAPIRTISDLLTGRIAGLQVFQASGTVGGDVQVQLRTPNSILLGTQPIVIVDGVRYTNTAARDPGRSGTTTSLNPSIYGRQSTPRHKTEVTSPLNDLNPNDIESIEVVKGPTAATLYGTDAANGVILITTKRGRAGPARWNAYVTGSWTEAPKNRIPSRYWGWGSYPWGEPFGVTVRGEFRPLNCTLSFMTRGICVQDSIAPYDPPGEIFESAPQWTYGMNVSGGSADVRYYVGGTVQQETGPIRMPQAFIDSIEAARGSPLPEEQLRPNALTNVNLRSNLSASFGRMQLQGNLGYVRRRNRTINHTAYSNVEAMEDGNPTDPWRNTESPADIFAQTTINEVDRFILGTSADWQVLSWLQARAGAGLDLSLGTTHSLLRQGEGRGGQNSGGVDEETTQQRGTSGSLGLTASLARGRVSSRTSVGAQYSHSLNDIRTSTGFGLIPGGESVMQADLRFVDRLYSETATLGSYAEQTLGLNGRLFLTAAVRMDGASNFGQKYQAAVYPKAGASWIVSEEPFVPRLPGIDEVRLRYAFGVSGQQAYSWMKVPRFATSQAKVEGAQVTGIEVDELGNENLRPERVREHEFGFDVAMLQNRVDVELAWYRRRVEDQIMRLVLPPGLGAIYTNLGLTTARGFDASIQARVLDSRLLSWDLSVNHSSSSTLLVDIGDAAAFASPYGGFKEGYPLGARFQHEYAGFEDKNGDGVIGLVYPGGFAPSFLERSEVLWGDTAVYIGVGVPPRTQSLHTTFGLLDQRVRVSASFNRRTGHVRTVSPSPCHSRGCRALLDAGTPLEEQARALALTVSPPLNFPADETRISALTLTAELPPSVLSRVGMRSGQISVSASNLALWTRYSLGDPGSMQVSGFSTGATVNVPQSRSWNVRFDLGF